MWIASEHPLRWTIVSFMLGMLLAANASSQQREFSAGLVYGGLYAPGQWNAVSLRFPNSGDSLLEGEARLPIIRDPGNIEMRLPVYVPPHARLKLVAPVFMPPLLRTSSKGRIPLISAVAWHDRLGARIGRTDLLGEPMPAEVSTDPGGLPGAGFVLSLIGRETVDIDAENCSQILAHYKAAGICCASPTLVSDAMPSDPTLLAACRAIALRGINPDSLDQAQRGALLDYVRAGGILLIASPRQADALEQSWLAPYLPVRLVGWRQARQVAGIPLIGWLNVAEATPAEGAVLLREQGYVHAAYRALGLGRVVFVSFPASGLTPKHPEAAKLWQQLLAVERPPVGMEGTRLRRNYGAFMEPMLGRPAAPWLAAAVTISLYLLVILALQFWCRGVKRPMAFAASLAVALLIAFVFLGLTAFKRQTQPLQSARLAVVDLGRGGGVAQELLAYAGSDDRDFSIKAADERIAFHPIFNQGESAIVTVPPFAAPGAEVSADRVRRVWESRWPVNSGWDVSATAAFTAEGLSLRVNNASALKLEAAQLVWRGERFMVGDMGADEGPLIIGDANRLPPGEFISASGIASQDQRHKGEIIAALMDRTDASSVIGPADAPSLLAWVAQPPQTLLTTPAATQRGDQVLARVRVPVEPTQKGQKVHIESSLSRIDYRESRGLPYNAARDEWNKSNASGRWLVALRAVAQAGTLRPEKIRLHVELDAPAYEVTLRRGQVREGKAVENPAGSLVKQWSGPIGPQAPIEFDCDSSDVDPAGRLWLMLDINLPERPAGGLVPGWRILQLSAAMDGEVVAPPADDIAGVLR